VTRLIALLAILLSLASPASARQDAAPVRAEVGRFLAAQTRSLSGQVTIQVGEFSADNQLAPCLQLEAFLPPNGRAWGRISVGVRCLAPVSWTAWVPADVRVKGTYVITNGPLAAGQIVGPGDLRVESGELTTLAADVITDPVQAIGQAARISLGAGRPLAASHLRQQPAVMQGQPVKVVSGGAGFQVANDGVALSSAANGQAAQVRLSNGQVVRGIARSGGVVEITLP
jgi:flagella basal body P-ring formation protein FlgA